MRGHGGLRWKLSSAPRSSTRVPDEGQKDVVEGDDIMLLAAGALSLLGGIGYALVKTDSEARRKDEKRFGPLSNFGMGFGYVVFQYKLARIIVSAFAIGLGILFILSAFGVIN